MLRDCLEVFKRKMDQQGDMLILDSYIPADGTYIMVRPEINDFVVYPPIDMKYDKKTNEISAKTHTQFKEIKAYDYYSKLIDMNKPIDKKKIIQSNNYYSFVIKKESINNGKLTEEIIDNYYEILSHPIVKYEKSKESKKMYLTLEKEIGQVDLEKLDKIRQWIKSNIFQLACDFSGKDYLKIFFQFPIEEYIREYQRYIIPNIYNSNDFNVNILEEIYGLPNDNMGLNSKKTYLENKTRKVVVPTLLSNKEVMLQRKFFDYLMNQVVRGNCNIYINTTLKEIESYPISSLPKHDFEGIFLRLKKGKEVEIHNYDSIASYRYELTEEFHYRNILNLSVDHQTEEQSTYGLYYNREDIQKLFNEVLFSNYLITNYFTEASDLPINDGYLKNNFLMSRDAIFNWIYKSVDQNIEAILNKITLSIVKGSLINGYTKKVGKQFNLRWSIIEYFKQGGQSMADIVCELKSSLRTKINQAETTQLESDKEYYFAVGQLVNYFISLSKGSKKMHSLANPFINGKNNKVIKEHLRQFYKKYNYNIEFTSRRFNSLYAMIQGYDIDGEVDQDMIIAGYLNNNLIYEKSKEEV